MSLVSTLKEVVHTPKLHVKTRLAFLNGCKRMTHFFTLMFVNFITQSLVMPIDIQSKSDLKNFFQNLFYFYRIN